MVRDTMSDAQRKSLEPILDEFYGSMIKAIAACVRSPWEDAFLNQIALFRPDGTFLMAFGGEGTAVGQFSFPAGIAAHPDGRVAVVDSLNKRVQIFSLLPTRDPRHSGP